MQLVANLGFPAIVTMYLLVRIEGKLENLSISINSLNSNIGELNNKMWKGTYLIQNRYVPFFLIYKLYILKSLY